MIPLPVPNTRAHPYRGLSVQEVDFPLTEEAVLALPPRPGGLPAHRLPRAPVARRHGARRGAQGEPRAAVLAGGRGTAAGRTRRDGVGREPGDRRRQLHLARRRSCAGCSRDRGPRTLRARQLHLGAGADHGAGHRGGPAVPAEAVRPGAAGDRVRRGPPAGGARARRRRRARPRRGQPGLELPAAVPGIRHRARCPGLLPRHPSRRAPRLDAHRVRAVAAVPPPLLRRRTDAGRPVPEEARRGRPGGIRVADPHQVLPDRARLRGRRDARGRPVGHQPRRDPGRVAAHAAAARARGGAGSGAVRGRPRPRERSPRWRAAGGDRAAPGLRGLPAPVVDRGDPCAARRQRAHPALARHPRRARAGAGRARHRARRCGGGDRPACAGRADRPRAGGCRDACHRALDARAHPGAEGVVAASVRRVGVRRRHGAGRHGHLVRTRHARRPRHRRARRRARAGTPPSRWPASTATP